MELTIFSKRRTTNEGKKFFSYLTTMTRKDGTTIRPTVRFCESCGQPKPDECPMNIIVDKSAANLSAREYVIPKTGEVAVGYTLWVKAWDRGAAYVDHSLDDFE